MKRRSMVCGGGAGIGLLAMRAGATAIIRVDRRATAPGQASWRAGL